MPDDDIWFVPFLYALSNCIDEVFYSIKTENFDIPISPPTYLPFNFKVPLCYISLLC